MSKAGPFGVYQPEVRDSAPGAAVLGMCARIVGDVNIVTTGPLTVQGVALGAGNPIPVCGTAGVGSPVSVSLGAQLPAGANLIGAVGAQGVAAQGAAAGSLLPVFAGGIVKTAGETTGLTDAVLAALMSDRYGRLITGRFDPAAVLSACAEYTTAQTGTVLVTPTSGKRILVVGHSITTLGVTPGRVVLWFGASADTTYTINTDRAIFDGTITPSASASPGFPITQCEIPADAVDRRVRVTSDANISFRANVYYIQLSQ